MIVGKFVRIPFLFLILIGTMYVLANGMLTSHPLKKSSLKAINFPEVFPVSGWKMIESNAIVETEEPPGKVRASTLIRRMGRQYRYKRKNRFLEIAIYHIGTGKVMETIKSHYQIESQSVKVHYDKSTGYYSLFSHEQNAFLGACINPRGPSTVTVLQHRINKILNDVSFKRLISWLLGQKRLVDQRCLVTVISVSFKESSPEYSYQIIESLWPSWHQWWQSYFRAH